jgi:SulP family sulfate permease
MIQVRRRIAQLMWDISGAFGDIGVMLPIALVLIGKNGFNPTALFLSAGLFYILAAYYFKVTMPVQPLKAMSAIAITAGLGPDVINAAGIMIGVVFLIIALTGLGKRLGSFFPVPVVRGIQLGLGLMLIKASAGLMSIDYVNAAVACAILILGLSFAGLVPPLIPIMIFGTVLSVLNAKAASFGPVGLKFSLPEGHNLWIGLTVLVFPQLALSFGNAIVAAEATGKMLYAERAKRLTLKSIPLSMGIANVLSGITGGVPMCHGSGGFTAHFKFGARRETSGYIIGLVLIAIALVLGRSGLTVLSAFPRGILGVLLCYVGIQHALFVKEIRSDKKALAVALSVAAISLLTNNLTTGFMAGIGLHYCLSWRPGGMRREVKQTSSEARS